MWTSKCGVKEINRKIQIAEKLTSHNSEKTDLSDDPANEPMAETAHFAWERVPSRHTLSRTG